MGNRLMDCFTEENVYSKIGKQVKAKRVIMVKAKSRYKKLPKGTLGKVTGVKVVDLDGCPFYRVSIEWQTRISPPFISLWDEWQYDSFLEEIDYV
jgi:hypothetical protein